jgi:hypothetical protein
LWKFTRMFWNCEAPFFRNVLVNTLNKIITHYSDWPIRPSSWTFFAHLRTVYTVVLQFLHSFHLDDKPYIIYERFPQHSWISVNKADNSVNFEAGGIISRRTQYNSLCRGKNKVTSYRKVSKAMSHVTPPRVSPLHLHYLSKINEMKFQNSPHIYIYIYRITVTMKYVTSQRRREVWVPDCVEYEYCCFLTCDAI